MFINNLNYKIFGIENWLILPFGGCFLFCPYNPNWGGPKWNGCVLGGGALCQVKELAGGGCVIYKAFLVMPMLLNGLS